MPTVCWQISLPGYVLHKLPLRKLISFLSMDSLFKNYKHIYYINMVISSVQSFSHVWLFATTWTAVCQAFLSITNSWSFFKLMYIKKVMPSNHLNLCHPLLLLPSIFSAWGSFTRSQFFISDGQSIGVSASTSVLPMNIQYWFPLGLTGLNSLQSNGLWRVFSNACHWKASII